MQGEQCQAKHAGEPLGICAVMGAAAGCAYKSFQFVIIQRSTSLITSPGFEFGDFLESTPPQGFSPVGGGLKEAACAAPQGLRGVSQYVNPLEPAPLAFLQY